MGFGGINSHVTLSSGNSATTRLKSGIAERALFVLTKIQSYLFWAKFNDRPLQNRRKAETATRRHEFGRNARFGG
ncbi:MAG UNVERIFIED_CONTAM: hypothetical protein LVR29_03015 [Microcystis novacekii LVE1205-3]|jgi:hypothetical protein